jgi:lipoprotein-anchoring transpeptidase ErfK/SrfK
MSVRRRALVPATVLAASALALSGCSFGQLGVRAGSVTEASSATISVTPAPTGQAVTPSDPVVVKVAQGRLTDVVVTGPDGPVAGALSVDGHTWTSEVGTLDYAATYSVSARAVDRVGLPTDVTQTLTTVAPSKFLEFSMSPKADATVGVGLPIKLQLGSKLKSDAAKQALEKHLKVTADGAEISGSWNWLTDDVLEYRPETYWPGNSDITVAADLKGVKFTKGLWGEKDRTVTFHTGPAMISYVDMQSDQLKVTKNGKTIRVIPITTGKPGFETRSGVKVIMMKERTRLMDASTGGTNKTDPEYYRLTVEYAMRLTWSGEFLHAAPWSVGSQGRANVSHGCTGMSTSNAAWLYANSTVGDVVVYTGNSKMMEPGNGIGVWNISWKKWQQGSALAA